MLIPPNDRKARYDAIHEQLPKGNLDKLLALVLDFAKDYSACKQHKMRWNTVMVESGMYKNTEV